MRLISIAIHFSAGNLVCFIVREQHPQVLWNPDATSLQLSDFVMQTLLVQPARLVGKLVGKIFLSDNVKRQFFTHLHPHRRCVLLGTTYRPENVPRTVFSIADLACCRPAMPRKRSRPNSRKVKLRKGFRRFPCRSWRRAKRLREPNSPAPKPPLPRPLQTIE